VLIDVQTTSAHEKYLKQLEQLLGKRKKAFVAALQTQLDRLLADEAGGAELERLQSFVVAFGARAQVKAKHGSASRRLGIYLLPHLLVRADASDKNVRERSCAMLAALIDQLASADQCRDKSLFEDVLDAMIRVACRVLCGNAMRLLIMCVCVCVCVCFFLQRCEDRVASVRAAAVRALRRLQAIGGVAVAKVMTLAAADLAIEVRLAAVESVHVKTIVARDNERNS
jgi:hypothetical protein